MDDNLGTMAAGEPRRVARVLSRTPCRLAFFRLERAGLLSLLLLVEFALVLRVEPKRVELRAEVASLGLEVRTLRVELRAEEVRVLDADRLDLLCAQRIRRARPAAAAPIRAHRRPRRHASARELDELPVGFVLDQPVHVPVTGVVPHALRLEFERVQVRRRVVVRRRVSTAVAPAADVAADEADPKVCRRGTGGTCRESSWSGKWEWSGRGGRGGGVGGAEVLGVAAYGTPICLLVADIFDRLSL